MTGLAPSHLSTCNDMHLDAHFSLDVLSDRSRAYREENVGGIRSCWGSFAAAIQGLESANRGSEATSVMDWCGAATDDDVDVGDCQARQATSEYVTLSPCIIVIFYRLMLM